jgi:hypothetical protein
VHEVGIYVNLESFAEHVADEPGQLRVKSRFPADELNSVYESAYASSMTRSQSSAVMVP